jgi:outer membrane protein
MIRSSYFTVILALAILIPPATVAAETLDLARCLELATEHSPELASSRQQLLSTRAALLGAYGSFLPSIGSSMSYSHQFVGPKPASTQYNTITQEFFVLDPIESRDYEYYNFGLTGDLTLFSGFSRWAELDNQKLQLAAGEADLDGAHHELEGRVIKAYYDLVKAQLLVELKRSSLKARREQHEQTGRSFTMGAVARSDTLRSGVRLAEARLELLESTSNRDLANVSLATLIERDPSQPLELEAPELGDLMPVDHHAAVAAALGNHPTLRAAAFRSTAAQSGIRQAQAGLWPRVNAGYRFGWSDLSGPDELLDVFQQDYTYSLSLSASWSLFDRFQTKRSVQQARAGARQQEYNLDLQSRSIIQSVESTLVSLENSRKRVELARATITLAKEDLRLARERYRVGAATLLEVTEAEVSLVQAHSSEIDGITGYLSAMAELERNTGLRLGR